MLNIGSICSAYSLGLVAHWNTYTLTAIRAHTYAHETGRTEVCVRERERALAREREGFYLERYYISNITGGQQGDALDHRYKGTASRAPSVSLEHRAFIAAKTPPGPQCTSQALHRL
jgi:hypothetical protein